MVLLERIELSTSPLPRECSTTELQQRYRSPTGRSERIRTSGPLLPKQVLYRAELHSDCTEEGTAWAGYNASPAKLQAIFPPQDEILDQFPS